MGGGREWGGVGGTPLQYKPVLFTYNWGSRYPLCRQEHIMHSWYRIWRYLCFKVLRFNKILTIENVKLQCTVHLLFLDYIASFPGSPHTWAKNQARGSCFSALQAMESWRGLGTYNSLTGFIWLCHFRNKGRVWGDCFRNVSETARHPLSGVHYLSQTSCWNEAT